MDRCRICGNSENNVRVNAREMMLGLCEEFLYVECVSCGCVQIARAPADLSRYYPPEYYAFGARTEAGPLKRFLKRRRAAHLLGHGDLLGRLLTMRFGPLPLTGWVRRAEVGLRDTILDVGAGRGRLLLEMSDAGFKNLTGVDPYIEKDLCYRHGVAILKRTLEEVEGTFDFIMSHHSFEHMPDPLAAFRQLHRLLKPGRMALIRIPVAQGFAWRTYRADWVQLDAPRHLFLHTEASIRILAEQTGLELEEVFYDSNAFQFWGSEQYRRQIPLHDPRSLWVNPHGTLFTPKEMRQFEEQARVLNEKGDGDQAGFYLRKP